MLFPLLLVITSVADKPAPRTPTTAAQGAQHLSLLEAVAQRMTPQGRAIFTQYASQTLAPKANADREAEMRYLQSLHAIVAAPKLDVDAAYRTIDQRKVADADFTSSIRASAFAMIKSLPEVDRKLALTAIFADARLPAKRAAASTR